MSYSVIKIWTQISMQRDGEDKRILKKKSRTDIYWQIIWPNHLQGRCWQASSCNRWFEQNWLSLRFLQRAKSNAKSLTLHKHNSLDQTNKSNWLVIFCDSKAAFKIIKNVHSRLVPKIHTQLEKMNNLENISILQRMPTRIGTPGYEEVDSPAKEAGDQNEGNKNQVTLDDSNVIAIYILRI